MGAIIVVVYPRILVVEHVRYPETLLPSRAEGETVELRGADEDEVELLVRKKFFPGRAYRGAAPEPKAANPK